MNRRIKQQGKLESGAYPQPLTVSNKVSTKKSIKQIQIVRTRQNNQQSRSNSTLNDIYQNA